MTRGQPIRPVQSIKLPEVKFEEYDTAVEDVRWRVRLRGHTGFGRDIPSALDDLERRLLDDRAAFDLAREASKRLPIASVRGRRR